jgi:hypothetical protein
MELWKSEDSKDDKEQLLLRVIFSLFCSGCFVVGREAIGATAIILVSKIEGEDSLGQCGIVTWSRVLKIDDGKPKLRAYFGMSEDRSISHVTS